MRDRDLLLPIPMRHKADVQGEAPPETWLQRYRLQRIIERGRRRKPVNPDPGIAVACDG